MESVLGLIFIALFLQVVFDTIILFILMNTRTK
nr:MAG TPA: HCMV UL42 [Caudoviricetes sp.]